MTLSDCLRDRLRADSRSLGQLALRMGVSKSALSRWLNGPALPSAATMDRAFALLVSEGFDPLAYPCGGRNASGSKAA